LSVNENKFYFIIMLFYIFSMNNFFIIIYGVFTKILFPFNL